VKDAEDRLKMVTNMVADPGAWDSEIIPTDEPSFEPFDRPDVAESTELALENRSDYLQARIAVENSDISARSLRNSLLPSLDLTAEYSLNGLGPTYDEGIDQLQSRDYNSWNIGISMDIPIGNRPARSLYERAKLEKKRSLLNLEKFKQSVAMEVRRSIRSIDTNSKRVQATEIALRLEEQRLKAEEERFRLGVSTSNDVLQAQRDLATAKTSYLKAIVDYRKSLTGLERVKGTLLDSLGIGI
jgi:outer membrane protein TolC